MIVWDLFPFWRERWAAEARLHLWQTLAPEVDYRPVAFVGDRTHRGNPLPPGLPSVPEGVEVVDVTLDAGTDWGREQQQRDAAYLLKERMDPDDLVLLGDADEIVDPRRLAAILAETIDGPVKLAMALYYYGTRWRQPAPWIHAAACRARDLPVSVSQSLRTRAGLPVVPVAGWHLSWGGSDEDRALKLSAFAHSEYDTDARRSRLPYDVAQGLDVHGRRLLDDPMVGPLANILAGHPADLHPEARAVLDCLTDPAWSVLEVGPGSNPTPWPGDRYVSVDHTPAGLHGTAGNQAGQVSTATHCADMADLPFADDTFDAVISRHVIEHHADTLTVLREWRRVLKRGGRVVLVTPDQGRYVGSTVALDPTHFACFTEAQLAALARHAGFTDVHTHPVDIPTHPGWSFLLRGTRA